MPENSNSHQSENIIINEAQLILAEKRTSLAVLRTGIAVLVLPLSVSSLLIVTSKYYDIIQVMHLFLPLMILCTILAFLGGVSDHSIDHSDSSLRPAHQRSQAQI